MAIESFDDFRATEVLDQYADQKPFQFRDDPNNAEKTLEWLNLNFDACYRMAYSRMITYRRYHALFKGIHWRFMDVRRPDRDVDYVEKRPRQVVNFVFDTVNAKCAQMARLKSNITVIPKHDEQDDINDAECAKMLLDSRAEAIELNRQNNLMDKVKFIFGDAFMWGVWNPDAGDEMKPGVRIGDVDCFVCGPDRVFPERFKKKWPGEGAFSEQVNHVDYVEWYDIHELKAMYPKHASKIQENQREYYDFDVNEIVTPKNQVMVRCFYHRKTPFLPKGVYIKYTDDVILEWLDYPYDEDGLPFVHDGDIEMYNELWCRSYIAQIEQQQRMYNNVQSGIARDFGVGSAPKWVMPKGSAKISSLNNDFTVIEFTGPVAPQLVNNNPISPKAFEVQDRIEKKIYQFSKIYDISRGEVPSGVTANAALRFLDEQESQQILPEEVKRKRRVVNIYKMMLRRMQQFYDKGDGRIARILGPNNEFLMESFESADINNAWDIKLENGPELPDTKVGKIAAIIDLNGTTQNDPIFRREEVIKMLDLGLDEAFKDGASVAVDAAKTLLSMILKGRPVPEPQVYDKHIVHYMIFDRFLQSTTFKSSIKQKTKDIILQRILTMETLMYDLATKNKKFLMELMELDNYPMLYTTPLPLNQLAANMMMAEQPMEPVDPGANTEEVKTINKPPSGE